jgi:hypothetical protein
MSARTPSVSAVIRLVNARPAFRIDVVGPDPPPVILLRPSAGWARSSAGPLLLDLRVVRAASIHRSTVASLRVTGIRVRHNMAAVRRRVALCSSIAGVACRADRCLPSGHGGRARSESVSAVMRHGRLGTIDDADRLAILTLDACHVQTPLQNGKASSYGRWALSIGLIDLPFSHWTHVTFKHVPVMHSLPDRATARVGAPERSRRREPGEAQTCPEVTRSLLLRTWHWAAC